MAPPLEERFESRLRSLLIVALPTTPALALLTAWSARPPAHLFLLNGWFLLATLAAMIGILVLSFVPRVRRQREFVPAWLFAKTVLTLACLAGILLLLLLAGATALARNAAWTTFLQAAVILMVASGMIDIWSHFALGVHRALRPLSPPAPPPASR